MNSVLCCLIALSLSRNHRPTTSSSPHCLLRPYSIKKNIFHKTRGKGAKRKKSQLAHPCLKRDKRFMTTWMSFLCALKFLLLNIPQKLWTGQSGKSLRQKSVWWAAHNRPWKQIQIWNFCCKTFVSAFNNLKIAGQTRPLERRRRHSENPIWHSEWICEYISPGW